MRRRKLAAGAAAFVVLLAAGWYWNQHRKVGLVDSINPMFWVRRWRGEDLYDSKGWMLKHGNRSLKEIALTIDDGPHSGTGDQLLDILKRERVRATFFVVGIRMKEQPDLIRRMIAEGHEVANHTFDHIRLSKLEPDQIRREINDNDINFYRITGRHLDLLRPPGVNYNEKVLKVSKDLGYQTIDVNVISKDFQDETPDFIVDRTLSRTENGSIILLHDDRMGTVLAMPRVIEALKRDGYKFVTVSEMLAHLPKPVIVATNANPPGNVVARTQ